LKKSVLTEEDLQGGTKEKPIVIKQDAIVNLTNTLRIEHVIFEGNLTLTGTPAGTLVISNVKVLGNLNISDIQGNISLEDIEVLGDTEI